jgi:uncharacterized protein YcfJ
MKKYVLFSAMGVLAASGAVVHAQEVGRVLSSTPLIQQVAVPRQVCSNQPVAVQQPNSGAGAVVGGVAGGVIGNQIGGGSGRAAATALGVIGGALLGNRVESNTNQPQMQSMQQCTTQTFYENRTTGYNVRYEYAGKEYQVQMPYDPGPTIKLQVTPMSSSQTAPAAEMAAPADAYQQPAPGTVQQAVVAGAQPVGVAPVYSPYPAYPVYAPAPYYYPSYVYPPVALSLGFGWWGGGGHWGGGHRWGGGGGHWGGRH